MQLHQAVLLCCLQILRRFLINYQYNVVGNRVSSIYEHPPSVNETTTYGYDAENRLTGIQITTDNKTRELAFAYDPFGRRISKTLVKDEIGTECAAPNTCPRTTYYAYDGANIILEYNQAGIITTRYTHGPNIDEPLSIEITGATAFTPYYYHTDGLGSITALSNATGSIVQRYEYDSFGNQTITTNGNIKQPFTFTGREYDTETGMYFYRARYYDPKAGRFITKDPIGFFSGDTNLYQYIASNPVNGIDPFGLQQFGIGIEPPASNAISNGVLNPSIDPGHTFAYLMNTKGQVDGVLSVGPSSPIGAMNKNSFLNGRLGAVANWPITGRVSTYQWDMTQQQYTHCLTLLNQMKSNPGNYSPTNQCTSAAISLAKKCGINVPSGSSAVNVPPIFPIFNGYSNNLPNPYGLQQQLNKTMTPTILQGTQF
jgi:RHS repeat-associated protein